MVADERYYPTNAAASARRPKRREPEGTSVPSARSFGSFSAAGQKMNIKILNQRALCAAVCQRAKKFSRTDYNVPKKFPRKQFLL